MPMRNITKSGGLPLNADEMSRPFSKHFQGTWTWLARQIELGRVRDGIACNARVVRPPITTSEQILYQSCS